MCVSGHSTGRVVHLSCIISGMDSVGLEVVKTQRIGNLRCFFHFVIVLIRCVHHSQCLD